MTKTQLKVLKDFIKNQNGSPLNKKNFKKEFSKNKEFVLLPEQMSKRTSCLYQNLLLF